MINPSLLKKSAIMIMDIVSTYYVALAQVPNNSRPIKNIVLVHGAFVDGSAWEGVYRILTGKGYKVTVTQHALQDFDEDLATVEKAIDLLSRILIAMAVIARVSRLKDRNTVEQRRFVITYSIINYK